MKRNTSNLSNNIAQLGVGLASRAHDVESDLVTSDTNQTKNLAVRLGLKDVMLLQELECWSRKNGLRPGWGTLLKAGLRLIRKDEGSLNVIRRVIESDGRRKI